MEGRGRRRDEIERQHPLSRAFASTSILHVYYSIMEV